MSERHPIVWAREKRVESTWTQAKERSIEHDHIRDKIECLKPLLVDYNWSLYYPWYGDYHPWTGHPVRKTRKKTWKLGGRMWFANLISCQEMYLAGQSKSAMTLGLQPLAAIEMGSGYVPTGWSGWPELQQHLLQKKSWWIQGWNSWNSSPFDPVLADVCILTLIKNRVLQTLMTHQICRRARLTLILDAEALTLSVPLSK